MVLVKPLAHDIPPRYGQIVKGENGIQLFY